MNATHFNVTAENINDVRPMVDAIDQRLELAPGCETWGIAGGWMTAWPHEGRAAVMHGGDSVWGDWDPNSRTLITDEPDEDGRFIVYDENGDVVPAAPDCD